MCSRCMFPLTITLQTGVTVPAKGRGMDVACSESGDRPIIYSDSDTKCVRAQESVCVVTALVAALQTLIGHSRRQFMQQHARAPDP